MKILEVHETTRKNGHGLGMWIVNNTITMSGGKIESIKSDNAKVIYLSPKGKTLNQEQVKKLAKENHIILLCGHYEGIDQRVLDEIVDEEISIGDYVLTGGEMAAGLLDRIRHDRPGSDTGRHPDAAAAGG